jgi:hypothetical protein
MIDRTLLTEALELTDAAGLIVVKQAARLLLDFPTDQQVEALVIHCDGFVSDNDDRSEWWYECITSGLEAIRDTMIGGSA